MFNGVTCINNQPIHSICVSEHCKISPFVCQNICECRGLHANGCVVKSLQQIDENIKTILKFQFFIVYSTILKGKSIHVAGRFAIQTQPPTNNQRFALTFDPIPRFTSETISFKLSQIRGCVGVGVFVREVIQKHDFKYLPDNQFLNHGAYMVMSNNLIYSHSRPEQNGKALKKFNLKEKDVIKVKYEKQKVTFIVNFYEQTLNIDLKAGERLHFGVYLYDQQDQVELVNTFVNKQ